MAQKPSKIREFQKRFPTEDACLTHLMRNRFGERFTCLKCHKEATYYRVKARRSFECEHCGYQVYPTAGTPFEKTRTSLRDWFYVMFLFCETRNGVAAKEVQRQLGVTYKTAWRMCHLIRLYMVYVDGDAPIGGPGKTVEADETFIGGVDKQGEDDKAIVLGIVALSSAAATLLPASCRPAPRRISFRTSFGLLKRVRGSTRTRHQTSSCSKSATATITKWSITLPRNTFAVTFTRTQLTRSGRR
jgi:hypothetical protein